MITGLSSLARRASLLLLSVLLMLAAREAHADFSAYPVDLSYRAPATCPAASEFLAEVRRSTEHLRIAKTGETARLFEVVIDDTGRSGRLVVEGGVQGQRAVTGADCAEVSRVLAFAVALAADPEAHPPSAQPAPEATSGAAFRAASAMTAFSADGEPKVVPPSAASPAPRHVPWRAPRRSATSVSLALSFLEMGANAPGIGLGLGGFSELTLNTLPLTPHLRLGLGIAHKNVDVDQGHVSFDSGFGSLELCSGLRRGKLTFLPCLRAQAGARTTVGVGLPNPRSETRPFLELGLAGHLRRQFGSYFFAEVGGGILFPTARDRVLIVGGPLVYHVPAVAGLGEISLGWQCCDQNSD
jgi:hypothetical protein